MRVLPVVSCARSLISCDSYSDQLVRRTMAKFYGQFLVDSFKRQMKENRKIEELILMFATHATTVLKKEPTLAGDGWKLELNNQIAVFVKMLRECLRSVNHVSPELLSRLDTYTAKLAPSQSSSDSGYDSASTSHRESISVPAVSGNVADMELVRVVAALFRIPESEVQKQIDGLRSICTEKAALTDLKVRCIAREYSSFSQRTRRVSKISTLAHHSPAGEKISTATLLGSNGEPSRPRISNNSWWLWCNSTQNWPNPPPPRLPLPQRMAVGRDPPTRLTSPRNEIHP